jgi:hypothetical protein
MAWKVEGKRMLLCADVQEKCASQWMSARAEYTMIWCGKPTSAVISLGLEKTACAKEKNLPPPSLFCYPEPDAFCPVSLAYRMEIILTKRGGAA